MASILSLPQCVNIHDMTSEDQTTEDTTLIGVEYLLPLAYN